MPGGMGTLGAATDMRMLQDRAMAPQCLGKGPLLAELAVGRGSKAVLPPHCWKFKYFIMHLL